MRDPHVIELHYKLVSAPDISYANPKPIYFATPEADFSLNNGTLIVTMRDHYATAAEADRVIRPTLDAWQMQADLTGTIGKLKFQLSGGQLRDRDPEDEKDRQRIQIFGQLTVQVSDKMDVHQTCTSYPAPPLEMAFSPDVESAYRRWMGVLQGKEPLLAGAYFIVTLLIGALRGWDDAAHALNVTHQVLRKLGELTSTRGDQKSARKAFPNAPLSQDEDSWIRKTVPELIIRLSRFHNGRQNPDKLTL